MYKGKTEACKSVINKLNSIDSKQILEIAKQISSSNNAVVIKQCVRNYTGMRNAWKETYM